MPAEAGIHYAAASVIVFGALGYWFPAFAGTTDGGFGHDMARKLCPAHPGEILREDFLLPMQLTPYAVARACGVPRTRIERLAREETPVTADTALRLGRYLGTTPAFWMNLQGQYDLEVAQDHAAPELKRIKPLNGKAA